MIMNKKNRALTGIIFFISLISLINFVSAEEPVNNLSTASSVDYSADSTPFNDTYTDLSITPASKVLKRGKKQRFRIDSEQIKGISERSGLRVKSIKNGFLWSVNNVEGGNRKIGKISRHGVYRAPRNISGSKHVRISAYNTELDLKTAESEVTIVSSKKYKNGILAIKAKWVSGKASRVSGSGIPEEVRKVRGVAVNNLTGEKYYAGPVDVEDRVLEFPGVPLEGSYTVTLEGVDDSGNVVYRGTVQGVKAVAPDERPKPVTIILKIVDGEIEVSSISPAITEINVGDTQQFSAEVTGAFDPTGKPLKWSVIGGSKYGTISADGLYTAPAIIPSPATAKVRATSKADSSKYSELSFTVIGNVTVTVSPPTASVSSGGTVDFNATVSGAEDKTVAWSVDGGSSNGTVGSTGLYTAPSVLTTTLVTVRATSSVDTSKSGTASVTVNPPAVPEVSSTNPASGATEVSVGTTISATFNETMDVSTINGSTFTVSGASGTVSYVSGTKTAVFTPSSALGFDTVYTATITTGVKSSAGMNLASNYVWNFTTEGTDVTPPFVSLTSPLNGATGVSVDTTVSATFSEAMNASTIHGDSFLMGVSKTISYDSELYTATLTPSAPLDYDTVYTATIYAYVTDLAGNPMSSDYVWSFKTEPLPSGSTWSKSFVSDYDDEAACVDLTSDGGYIVAGAVYVPGDYANDLWITKISGGGSVAWQKKYSGNYNDEAKAVHKTSDGGFIVAGAVQTTLPTIDSTEDFFVMKLNSDGSVAWQKTYGGDRMDVAEAIRETTDGGYIVAGWEYSFSSSGTDIWILKLDSSGSVLWQKTYGGTIISEKANSIEQTTDGGYIVAGWTTTGYSYDAWIFKLDSDGAVVWQYKYGGSSNDEAYSIKQTSDGGYIAAGYTGSYGSGLSDFWVLKLNSDGTVAWQKVYGDSSTDVAKGVLQTADGGYIVAGWTVSFGAIYDGDSAGWLLKLDSAGDIVWQKIYSFPDSTLGEGFNSIQQASDGGFIAAGFGDTYDEDVHDPWVLKLDSDGELKSGCDVVITSTSISPADSTATEEPTTVTPSDTSVSEVGASLTENDSSLTPVNKCYPSTGTPIDVLWAKTYGGIYRDDAKVVQQTSDFGYIVAGDTESSGAGAWDISLMKLKIDGSVAWQKTYGETHDDFVYSMEQTTDGGYIVAGSTGFTGPASYEVADIWVFKVDSAGNIEWQQRFGGGSGDNNDEVAYSVCQTSDGGYAVTGVAQIASGNSDLWVARLDSSGNVLWQKRYGGTGQDWGYSIQETSDSGFIVAGYGTFASSSQAWMLKLNSDGTINWQKNYGGANYETAVSAKQTTDEGYIVAAYSTSFAANGDIWILKLNSDGTIDWQNTYSGSYTDYPQSIQQTSDGGYAVAGYSYSPGLGEDLDSFILKLDSTGAVDWSNSYGDASDDYLRSIWQTTEGGYVVAGWTNGVGAGSEDFGIGRLDSYGEVGVDCPYAYYFGLFPSATDITPVDSAVSPVTSTLTVTSTAFTEASSSLTSTTICSAPLADTLLVYVMSSGNETADQAVIDALVARGHIPVIGADVGTWDGTQDDIFNYDVVVLLNNYNWSSAGTMPSAGVAELIDFVDAGGGLVTGEWLIWNMDSTGKHTGLETIIPADGGPYNGASSTTYTEETSDFILNMGLPSTFAFSLNYINGAESDLTAKSGATVFYSSSNLGGAGVVGWDYGFGRVISFSTLISEDELANSDYVTLFVNAVEWTSNFLL